MKIGVLLVILGVSTVGRASADPITATYLVNVTERCFAGGCEAFESAFSLTLRFDSGITFEDLGAQTQVRTYGPPIFSAVPLARPEVSSRAAESARTIDVAAFVGPPLGPWRHLADAQHRFEFTEEDNIRHVWHLGLHTIQDKLLTAPELTAASMARFLATPNGPDVSNAFRYVFSRSTPDGIWLPGSVGYVGSVSLAGGPAPIPEPATMTLLAAGMLLVGRRRFVRARRQR